MGMFDYLICEAPLPDGFDGTSVDFQTKDTPQQYCERYRITADGRLLERQVARESREDPKAFFGFYLEEVPGTEKWVEIPFHGDIEFYTSNVTAIGPLGVVTLDGGPVVCRYYVARFTDGRLARITGGAEDTADYPELVTAEEFQRRHDQARDARNSPTASTDDSLPATETEE